MKRLIFLLGIFTVLLISVYIVSADDINVQGENDYLANGFYIPIFNHHGILGKPPSGFAQTQEIISFSNTGENYDGSVSFFLKFDLKNLLKDGETIEDGARIELTFFDIDLIEQDIGDASFYENIEVILLKDGPENPEEPGSFDMPVLGESPMVFIDKNNFVELQHSDNPENETNNNKITYVLYFDEDFEEQGGDSIKDILRDINQDKEFSLYVTMSTYTRSNSAGRVINTLENIDGSEIIFKVSEVKKEDKEGGKKREMRFIHICEENWVCSDWTGCFEGVQSRSCQDTNLCTFEYGNPVEMRSCEIQKVVEYNNVKINNNPFPWLIFIFIGIVILIILIFIVSLLKG